MANIKGHRPETLAKMRVATNLREKGYTYEAIAQVVGYQYAASCHVAIKRYVEESGRSMDELMHRRAS